MENVVKEDKSKKNLIICILSFLLVLSFGFIVYDKVVKNNNESSNGNQSSNSGSSKYVLKVFGNNHSICEKQDISYCSKVVFTIDAETPDPLILRVSDSDSDFEYVLYEDNGLKLYDVDKKSIKKIDSDSKHVQVYEMLSNGFIYSDYDNDEFYYYDLSNNKKMYDNYDRISGIESCDNLVKTEKDRNFSLIDIRTGKTIITRNAKDGPDIEFKCDADYIFSYVSELEWETDYIAYTSDGKKIVDIKDSESYYVLSDQENPRGGNELVIYEKNLRHNYNKNGQLVK